MKLADLEPKFLKWISDREFRTDAMFAEADGIMFLCPKCFAANGGPIGTHVVICWNPHVPQSTVPGPGRWTFSGTGVGDLSLSPSVNLDVPGPGETVAGGCRWHGFVTQGEIR